MHGKATMESLVRLPRRMLYDSWRTACNKTLEEIVGEDPEHPAVMSLHLTWYKSDTGEFFSPLDLSELKRTDCSIVHVVILIDDIYDMFSRLRGDGALYGSDFMAHDRDALKKLTNGMNRDGLEVQAVENALGELLAWRRAEMIQAENIARSLGARLTVLGTKHHRDSLQTIVSDPDAPRIYLSHRISEHRRHNMATVTQDFPLGEWMRVVEEVNTLHRYFLEHRQVLINPTAIDELRFKNTSPTGRRDPLLGARWPLLEPTDELLCEVSGQSDGHVDEAPLDYEHTRILTADLSTIHPVSFSVSRSVANRILFEIPFRDHVIVENTPHLCVYRPFFCSDLKKATTQADWSSGVRPEVNHWKDTHTFTQEIDSERLLPSRRVAFVHTDKEIECRFLWLLKGNRGKNWDRFLENIRSPLIKNLQDIDVPQSEIDDLFAGHMDVRGSVPLERHPEAPFVVTNAEKILKAIRPAVQAALHVAFTSLERPGDGESESDETGLEGNRLISLNQIALYAVTEDASRDAQNLRQLVRKLKRFFQGSVAEDADGQEATGAETDPAAGSNINEDFWVECERCFRAVAGEELERRVAMGLKWPYDELASRC